MVNKKGATRFGCCGLLDVVKEAWEQQPAAHRTVVEHVRELREKIDRKKWVGTRDQPTALATSDPVVVDVNLHLSAAQKNELYHLVGQFSDVFSSVPGQTTILQHDIRMPPGVIAAALTCP
ncbi:hypothetical protein QQF64_017315 [Cirrhinus molitorella]|uniref:Uncharacterized protein n=1 Tax=Cirrhinus molitorella TaxID=172907 RepID=A0ABR3LIB8_9TELE